VSPGYSSSIPEKKYQKKKGMEALEFWNNKLVPKKKSKTSQN
jgi:hypothetical protein